MKRLDEAANQEAMVRQQIIARGISDARVIQAMRAVPREQFFPPNLAEAAYGDHAAPIGHGQTISQPYIVALMSQALQVQPQHEVLEIGTGSGYQAAILSLLAREVFTVERVKPLLDEAFDRLIELDYRNVNYRLGDGTEGWPGHEPFDRILIAAAAPKIPEGLFKAQLLDGGIAVLPVGADNDQTLLQVTRKGEELIARALCPVRFVKLVGSEGWSEHSE